jgi:glycerol-3-phosphate acyltransferase PlsX
LLGVDGVCIISHGSSGPTAIHNAITLASDLVDARLVDAIRSAVATPG